MIQNRLYEESASSENEKSERRWFSVFNVFQWIFVFCAVFLAVFALSFGPGMVKEVGENKAALIFTIVSWVLGILFFALLAFLFRYMKFRRNVSYDYSFVEDELRISKVFNGKKRKPLYKLKADQMLKIGYCEKSSFDRLCAGLSKKSIRILTPNGSPAAGKDFIYIHYSTSIEKIVYVIECRKMMLEYLVLAAGRNKFERE